MNQQSLFAQDNFEAAEVQEALQPILPLLWQGVKEPWDDYRRRVADDRAFAILPPAGAYQWLHYQIVDRIGTLFSGRKDARTCEVNGIFVLCFKDIYELSFKKLDENLMRSNSKTRHQYSYWEQPWLPGITKTINLIVGYQPRREGTEIEVYVTAPRPFSVAWSFVIPDQTEALIRLAETVTEQTPEPEKKKRFRIKPKKEDRKRENQ
jgi:hypothetical protein